MQIRNITLYALSVVILGFTIFKLNPNGVFTKLFLHQKVDTTMNIQNSVTVDDVPKELETQRVHMAFPDNGSPRISKKSMPGEYFTTYKSTNKNGVVKRDIYKIERDGKYGLCDEDKYPIVKAIYDNFEVFDEQKGLYVTERNGKCGLVNYKGRIIIPTKYESLTKTMNEDFIIVNNRKYSGLYDLKHAKLVVPAIYTAIKTVDDSNWIVSSNQKIGFLHSKNGVISLIKPKYQSINKYKMLYKAFLGDKVGLIDTKSGVLITEPLYDDVVLINEQKCEKDGVLIFRTKIENRYGLIYFSKESSVIISPIYEDVQYKGMVNVLSNGYWRILDNEGNVITRTQSAFK